MIIMTGLNCFSSKLQHTNTQPATAYSTSNAASSDIFDTIEQNDKKLRWEAEMPE